MPERVSSTLADWKSDWLYLQLLKERAASASRGVLIDEYETAQDSHCRGRVVRSWYRDRTGLREITPEERKSLRLKMRGRTFYPFTIVSFNIAPDRRHVVFAFRDAARGGMGWQYAVEERGQNGVLRRDPTAGTWIS